MIIVGKNTFSKKDKSGMCYQINCLVPFSDTQKAAGCDGQSILQIFVSLEFWEKVSNSDYNRECEFDYGMNSFGKPEPVAIRFAKAQGN